MCKETEVIAKGKKSILMDLYFPFRIEIGKYSSVLSQQAMYIPHKIV